MEHHEIHSVININNLHFQTVIAIGSGTKRIDSYRMAKLPKTFTVKGQLGIATDTHDPDGRIQEKTTYSKYSKEDDIT